MEEFISIKGRSALSYESAVPMFCGPNPVRVVVLLDCYCSTIRPIRRFSIRSHKTHTIFLTQQPQLNVSNNCDCFEVTLWQDVKHPGEVKFQQPAHHTGKDCCSQKIVRASGTIAKSANERHVHRWCVKGRTRTYHKYQWHCKTYLVNCYR